MGKMLKNKPLTSIITVAYDVNQLSRQITQLSLESICKYTDEEDYEIIFIDTIPIGAENLTWFDTFDVFQMGKRKDRVWIKQYLSEMSNPGTYSSYNKAVNYANGDYLCFTQNDVIVTEGWLSNMKYYLDNNIADVVYPDQFPKTREFVKRTYEVDYRDDFARKASTDAGMVLMRKSIFEACGGWPEGMIMFYGEKHLNSRLKSVGARVISTNKNMILHVNSGTYWARKSDDKDNLDKDVTISSGIDAKLEGRV